MLELVGPDLINLFLASHAEISKKNSLSIVSILSLMSDSDPSRATINFMLRIKTAFPQDPTPLTKELKGGLGYELQK